MLTEGEYSSYEVVALFTTRDLAMEYALALSTKEHEQSLERARNDLERYERDGSSWDETTIKGNWNMWVSMYSPDHAESAAKEIRDSRRNGLLASIRFHEQPLVMEGPDPEHSGWYGNYEIEEQELYDMVPVVKDDD
jgi:hypothetical protein